MNVEAVLDAVIDRVRTPTIFETTSGLPVENEELKALVFDSQYDSYR
jgi:translation elongation factor EF-4